MNADQVNGCPGQSFTAQLYEAIKEGEKFEGCLATQFFFKDV